MKKVLNIAILFLASMLAMILFCTGAACQTTVTIGSGYSITKHVAIATLNVGDEIDNLSLQGCMIAHIDDKSPAMFQGRVGWLIRKGDIADGERALVPYVGYAYHLRSTDNKQDPENGSRLTYGLQFRNPFASFGIWIVDVNRSGKYITVALLIGGIIK